MITAALSAEDWFGIHDLYARYSWGLDSADEELYLSAFTTDGRYRGGSGPEEGFRGHERLRENFRRLTGLPNWAGSQHYMGQLRLLESSAGRCTMKCYSTIVYRSRDGAARFRFLGIYQDTCVKNGSTWLFEERLWEQWDPDGIERYR